MREILRMISLGRRPLLFLDYDGTLVPIERTPDRAVLTHRKKRFLEALNERMFVCIVSGRSLTDVRRRIGIDGLAYIGNHGLEVSWGRRSWVHPQAKKRLPALGRLLKRIEARTERFPRLLIENKGVTGSVHFRRLDPALVSPLRRIVADEIRRKAGDFVVTEGKKVLEIRPALDWDKGLGIRKIMRWLPREPEALRIFIGDDRTDEDAFRSLGGDSITIHVGRGRATRARYRLADVERVWLFLQALSRIISPAE
ncbi:trehalose-phosphatase [bacterium]|nr:MAG: trehalose-phosphatase [bacterium]